MTLFMLILTCILLALGLSLLPPLTGEGLAGVVSRAWLLLAVLVFCGHYLYYLEEGARQKKRRRMPDVKAHRHSLPAGERSAEYR
jgi:hypothetical protein